MPQRPPARPPRSLPFPPYHPNRSAPPSPSRIASHGSSGAWGTEDVERTGSLDDLNPYLGIPVTAASTTPTGPSGPIAPSGSSGPGGAAGAPGQPALEIAGDPPWRRSNQGEGSTRSHFDRPETWIYSDGPPYRGWLPPAPDGSRRPTNRLTPMISLDEILDTARTENEDDRTGDDIATPGARVLGRMPARRSVPPPAPSGASGSESREEGDDFWHQMMRRQAPHVTSLMGTGDTNDDPSANANPNPNPNPNPNTGTNNNRPSIAQEAAASAETMRRIRTQAGDAFEAIMGSSPRNAEQSTARPAEASNGSANGTAHGTANGTSTGATDGAAGTGLPPATRRNSNYRTMTMARHHRPLQMVYDPEEIMPWDRDEDDDGLDTDSEGYEDYPFAQSRPRVPGEVPPTRAARNARQRDTLYDQVNRTTDDLSVLGGSGGLGLRRGRNNRRRRSLLARMQNQAEAQAEAQVDELMEERLAARGSPRSMGLNPTNGQQTSLSPLVVRSTGVRRQRRDSRDSLTPQKTKKRKANTDTDRSTTTIKASEVPGNTRPGYLQYTTLDPVTPLPYEFEQPSRASRVSLSSQSSTTHGPRPMITFTFSPLPHGPNDDAYASALRTKRPIPISCGIHYYEVNVLDSGEEGYMSVGWMKKDVDLNRLVGWDKGSWGWHGDDGRSFDGKGVGDQFGETWGKGDVVGCGLDFTTGQAFFTKNGKMVGNRFKNLGVGLHPAIGLRSPRESLVVNFTGPFDYDIDTHVRNVRDRIWASATGDTTASMAIPLLRDQGFMTESQRHGTDDLAEGFMDTLLPKSSILRDDAEKVSAAFVLDYLRADGHGKALKLAREEMRRRKWLSGPVSSQEREKMTWLPKALAPRIDPDIKTTEATKASISTDVSTTSDKLTAVFTDDPLLTDFETVEEGLVWLHRRIMSSHAQPLPWRLFEALPISTVHLRVLEYMYLLRQADAMRDSNASKAEEMDMRSIKYGQEALTDVQSSSDSSAIADPSIAPGSSGTYDRQTHTSASSDTNVPRGGRVMLMETWKEAFGLIGLPVEEWDDSGIAGEDRRRTYADQLICQIKQVYGIKEHSHLETAVYETWTGLRRLAGTVPEAAYMDVRRVWEGVGQTGSIKGIKGTKTQDGKGKTGGEGFGRSGKEDGDDGQDDEGGDDGQLKDANTQEKEQGNIQERRSENVEEEEVTEEVEEVEEVEV